MLPAMKGDLWMEYTGQGGVLPVGNVLAGVIIYLREWVVRCNDDENDNDDENEYAPIRIVLYSHAEQKLCTVGSTAPVAR